MTPSKVLDRFGTLSLQKSEERLVLLVRLNGFFLEKFAKQRVLVSEVFHAANAAFS